jgi:hypothetical protein
MFTLANVFCKPKGRQTQGDQNRHENNKLIGRGRDACEETGETYGFQKCKYEQIWSPKKNCRSQDRGEGRERDRERESMCVVL